MRFNSLPTEIQFDVFATFSAEDLCTTIAPVCRRWRQFAYEPNLWKQVTLNCFRQDQNQVTQILLHSSRIHRLELTHINNFSWLQHLPIRNSLREMWFHNCVISDEVLSQLHVTYPYIQSLEIGPRFDIGIGFSVSLISRWYFLSDLWLRHVKTADVNLVTIAKECINLISLRLSTVEPESESAFVELLKVRGPQLRRLKFCGLSEISSTTYQTLGVCRQLTNLELRSPKNLTDLDFIEFITKLKTLTHFCLSNNQNIFSTDFSRLSAKKSFPLIGEILLCHCDNLNAVALDNLAKCGLFKTLVTFPTFHLTFDDCVSVANKNGLKFTEKGHVFTLRNHSTNPGRISE